MLLKVLPPNPLEGQEIQNTIPNNNNKLYDLTFYSSNCNALQLVVQNNTGTVLDRVVVQVTDDGRILTKRKRIPKADKESADE